MRNPYWLTRDGRLVDRRPRRGPVGYQIFVWAMSLVMAVLITAIFGLMLYYAMVALSLFALLDAMGW